MNHTLNIISEVLKVNGSIYDIIEAYLNFKNKHFKNFQKEFGNQFNDYRENVEEKENCIMKN